MKRVKTSIAGYQFSIMYAVLLVLAYVAISGIIPTVLNRTLWRPLNKNSSEWLNLLTIILASIIFFIGYIKITGHTVTVFSNITLTGILLAVGCSILFFFLLDKLIDPVIDRMFPTSAEDYQVTLTTLRQSPATSFIRVCLFAPIAEEILMRGFIFTGLQNRHGVVVALVVSTILFALLHFNFSQTISSIISGLILGLLYIKTDSLFCCVVAHSLYNSISYFSMIAAR